MNVEHCRLMDSAVVGFLPQMANSRKEIEIDFQNGKVIAAMTNRSSIGTGAK